MERRLLLVFALTFLVIVLFQPILKRYLPQPPSPPAQNQTQPQRNPWLQRRLLNRRMLRSRLRQNHPLLSRTSFTKSR